MFAANSRRSPRVLGVSLILFTLASCGGGGGGGSNSGGYSSGGGAGYASANSAPVWSAYSEAVQVAENSSEVTLSSVASDADGDTLSYSISGEDADSFTGSSSGSVSFVSAPDYESPQDADSNNVYEISIDVSDGSATASLEVSISITDVNEGSVGSGGLVAGVVVAGSYLSNASVFQDVNGNGVRDEDEAGAATNVRGVFSLR